MKHRGSSAARQRKGAAAAEFALLVPFLVFVFSISVDFGRVFYYTQAIEACAKNGALYASDPQSPANSLYASLQKAAEADAADLSPKPTATSTTGKDANGDSYVRVTVTWQFTTFASIPGVSPSVTLTRTVQMRMAP